MRFEKRFRLSTLLATSFVLGTFLMFNFIPIERSTGYGITTQGDKIPAVIYLYGWPRTAFWWRPEMIQGSGIKILAGATRQEWYIGGIIVDLAVFFVLGISSLLTVEAVSKRVLK